MAGGNSMNPDEEVKVKSSRDAFASIAFWQILAFVFLLVFVWASELLDFPAQAFGDEGGRFSIYRASIISAAILAVAVVVGHTYERQRALLRSLLKTCMYCHRVETPEGKWEHVEVYFIRHYPVPMDRTACPTCEAMLNDAASKKVLETINKS